MPPHPLKAQGPSKSDTDVPLKPPSPRHLSLDAAQEPSGTPHAHQIHSALFREGSFAYAQGINIGTAYMNEFGWTLDERYAEEERRLRALEKLAAKGLHSAMLDSRDRGYVPRCNENTRQTIRRRIIRWGWRHGEIRRLLWLSGPAGVGKSAVAQTVAEEFKGKGLLGGVFFFSRPNNRSDPDVVIPTLVYQLAMRIPEYRHIITDKITQDPIILDRNRRTQFQEFIIDPFLTLMTQHPTVVQQPLLIVLDGLDECINREAQCEFVEMISHHVREQQNTGLRWMICSRPEPSLKVSFSTEDCKAICLQEKLDVDDSEAQDDALRILRKGFADIRDQYPDQLTQGWPTEDQINLIASRASGHLGFVSFILRFIGDKNYDDPYGQLEICLRFLKLTSGHGDLNPLYALDLLYTQVLSDIPASIFPTTLRILGLFVFYNAGQLSAVAHANFLGLDQATFYRALHRLHSVVLVPPVDEAHRRPIQIYHASFTDYLKDPARCGKFALDRSVVPYLDVAVSGLKWLGYARRTTLGGELPELVWIPPKDARLPILISLCKFSFVPCWQACPQVPKGSQETLIKALEEFDFNLDYFMWWKTETRDFAYFIRWLASMGAGTKSLITIRPPQTDHSSEHVSRGAQIRYRDGDPYAFVTPFYSASHDDYYSIPLRLGRLNPTLFFLIVGIKPDCSFVPIDN